MKENGFIRKIDCTIYKKLKKTFKLFFSHKYKKFEFFYTVLRVVAYLRKLLLLLPARCCLLFKGLDFQKVERKRMS